MGRGKWGKIVFEQIAPNFVENVNTQIQEVSVV
jgi:hypothetical protein